MIEKEKEVVKEIIPQPKQRAFDAEAYGLSELAEGQIRLKDVKNEDIVFTLNADVYSGKKVGDTVLFNEIETIIVEVKYPK